MVCKPEGLDISRAGTTEQEKEANELSPGHGHLLSSGPAGLTGNSIHASMKNLHENIIASISALTVVEYVAERPLRLKARYVPHHFVHSRVAGVKAVGVARLEVTHSRVCWSDIA